MPGWAEAQRKTGQRGPLITATIGSKKDPERAITPAVESVRVPAHLVPTGSAQAKLPCHLHAQLSLGQGCLRHKSPVSTCTGSLPQCPRDPVDWPARLLSGRGFSQQEARRILADTGRHTLLEHCISCCPSRQLSWVPGAARTPATQAGAPPPALALGANPSPPGQPQERTPVDDPHAEAEIKPQLKPTGSAAKEEDPEPSHQLYKLQIESTRSPSQTLCPWNI